MDKLILVQEEECARLTPGRGVGTGGRSSGKWGQLRGGREGGAEKSWRKATIEMGRLAGRPKPLLRTPRVRASP